MGWTQPNHVDWAETSLASPALAGCELIHVLHAGMKIQGWKDEETYLG